MNIVHSYECVWLSLLCNRRVNECNGVNMFTIERPPHGKERGGGHIRGDKVGGHDRRYLKCDIE